MATLKSTQYSLLKKPAIVFVIVLLIAVAACLGWQNWQLKHNDIEAQNRQMLKALSTHLLLPQDEDPTIAIIKDVDTLKSRQAFFNDARNGDQLVIYAEASKAIIYREEGDLIINVGPLNLTTTEADGAQ
ncbi:MAG: hypothetical protein KIH62_004370 [Candidatus Kerfeldbacteria bacterium]|nr:hypothetical protein [Candidatus Kerfeldbacteria bacterium]